MVSNVEIVNTVDMEKFEQKSEDLLDKGYEMKTADIGTNELGEPFYRAILVKNGDSDES